MKHTHRGRPVYEVLWKNQYGTRKKCTKCEVTFTHLTGLGLMKALGDALTRCKAKLLKSLFSPNPMYEKLREAK